MTAISKSPRTPSNGHQFLAHLPLSSRQCHARRRLLILLAIALAVSSGFLIVFHLTSAQRLLAPSQDPYSSFSSSSSSITRWTAQRFKGKPRPAWKDYEEVNGPNQGPRENDKNEALHDSWALSFTPSDPSLEPDSSDPRRTFGRPRAALPHHNTFNDEREQQLMQQQLEIQEQQLKQLPPQQPGQPNSDHLDSMDFQDPQLRPSPEVRGQQLRQTPDLDPTKTESDDNEQRSPPQFIAGSEGHSGATGFPPSALPGVHVPPPPQGDNGARTDGTYVDKNSGSNNNNENNNQSSSMDNTLHVNALNPRPFEETLEHINSTHVDETRYLTYLPYAGITNQFYGMLRAMEIAKALGRTLIIPPITSSSHDKSKQNQPWSKFLDLKKFTQLTGLRVVEFHELRDAERTGYNTLRCHITCGFGSKRTIDFTAKGFLRQWRLNATLTPLPIDDGKLETILATMEPLEEDKYICISNTYKIMVKDKSEWERFGQHLHFTRELEDFVKQFLEKNVIGNEVPSDSLITTTTTLKTTEGPSPVLLGQNYKYLTIHIRRGDFAKYCEGNFSGPKMIHCLPTTKQIAERVDLIQQQWNPTLDPTLALPVFVATNERDPLELRQFANLGWRHLNHEAMGTVEALGVFGPMMVDQVFMAYSTTLIGIQMSTFSRVGALRQRDWQGRQVEYM